MHAILPIRNRIYLCLAGEMAVLDERQLRAALQQATQPVIVLTVPVLEPLCTDTEPVSAPLDALLLSHLPPNAFDARVEEYDAGSGVGDTPMTFRLSFRADQPSLVLNTEQGLTSLRCVLANRAALQALALEDEQVCALEDEHA
jgi:hypothetical protein